MTNPKSRIFAAVAGALSVGAAGAWAADASQDAQIKALEAKVAALEAKTAANSKDVAATIDSVLRDAERRSQLMAATGDSGAGYDNGFYIRTGAFELKPQAQFQFRNVLNWRDDADGGDDDEIDNGFEVRRMKLELAGFAITRDLEYFFQWATAREGGGLVLEDAWVKWMFADAWGLRAGQYKDNVHHEEMTSSKRQMAADRSMTNELLGGGVTDRVQGVNLIYGGMVKGAPLNIEAGMHDGVNSDNTDFTKHAFDFGVAARVEFLVMGDWRAYRDFTAIGTKESLLALGAGGDWSQAGDGNIYFFTLDGQFETVDSLGLYGALLIVHRDEEFAGGGDDVTDFGLVLQASFALNKTWELFGRWDGTFFDEDVIADEDFFHEFTFGVNYYLGTDGSAGHRAKITVDLSWLPNGAPDSDTGLGILNNNGGENEVIIRTQFQLLI